MKGLLSLLLSSLFASAFAGHYELLPNPGTDPDNYNDHYIRGGMSLTSIPDGWFTTDGPYFEYSGRPGYDYGGE